MSRRSAPLVVLLLLTIAVFAGLAAPSITSAQRDRPQPTPNPRLGAAAARYGTRHALPALAPPGGLQPQGELRITNAGWLTSTIAVIEMGLPQTDSGCEGPASPVIQATCLGGLGALATLEHRPAPSTSSLWVYSLDPRAARAACRELDQVARGTLSHEAWAQAQWWTGHGDPLAVAWLGESPRGSAASEGLPVTGMREILGAGGGQPRASLPQFGPASAAYWVNGEDTCLPITARTGAALDQGECDPAALSRGSLLPLGILDASATIDASLEGSLSALAAQGRGELLGAVGSLDDRGWSSYSAGPVRLPQIQESGTTALPMVITPLDNADAEVWVTNQHLTRTAKVSLLMWDGNLAQLVPYRDPLGLCAGATRRYEIGAIAGEIPPTNAGRRGDVNVPQPPYLSMRAEAVSEDGTTYMPISASVVLHGEQGIGAYGGLNLPLLAVLRSARGDGSVRGTPPTVTILPDVRIAYGPQKVSTFLSVMTISPNANLERQALVELYDENGTSVAEPLRIQMGTGPGGFLDLGLVGSRIGARFPDGFRGTALVRGALNRGTIGVVGLNRPTAPDAMAAVDGVTVHSGIVIARGPDPSLPTATPRPTFPPQTATPVRQRQTPTPNVEPTPEAAHRLHLPYLIHE